MEENLEKNPQVTNPQIDTTTPPIKPKKAFKKWILIGIIFVLILSLPLGGYLVLGKLGISPKPSTVTLQKIKPTPTPNPTHSWKTYQGEGFSFKYPDIVNLNKKVGNSEIFDSNYFSGMQLYSQKYPIESLKVKDTFTLYSKDAKSYQITVNNVSVKQELNLPGGRIESYSISCGVDCDYFILEFQSMGKFYRLYFDGAGAGLYKRFNDMVSTFKFTDQNTPTPTSNSTLKIPEFGVQVVLSDDIKDAYYIGTTADKGYVYLKVHSLDSEPQCLKADSSTAALSKVGKDEINPMTQEKYSAFNRGATIGNYYYYIDLAQFACAQSSSGQTLLEKVRSAFVNAVITQ